MATWEPVRLPQISPYVGISFEGWRHDEERLKSGTLFSLDALDAQMSIFQVKLMLKQGTIFQGPKEPQSLQNQWSEVMVVARMSGKWNQARELTELI